MLKFITLLPLLLATAWTAPAANPAAILPIADAKTPASTTKWAAGPAVPLTVPVPQPYAAVVPPAVPLPHTYAASVSPQIAPYAYAYSAPVGSSLVYLPAASYSIEQHGYNIAY